MAQGSDGFQAHIACLLHGPFDGMGRPRCASVHPQPAYAPGLRPRVRPVLRLVSGAPPHSPCDPIAPPTNLGRGASGETAPGVKQQAACRAARMTFDWLIGGKVVPTNPASAVRGPRSVVTTGKTPVLDGSECRRLLDAIPTETVHDLRDRALIGTLTYSLARIGAAIKMTVEDLRPNGTGHVFVGEGFRSGYHTLVLIHHIATLGQAISLGSASFRHRRLFRIGL
jgi:hypothetical protein